MIFLYIFLAVCLFSFFRIVIKTYNLDPDNTFTRKTKGSQSSNFSRVRGKTNFSIEAVMNRINFGKSDIFSRCNFCKGLKIRGICQACGGLEPCSWCGGVIQPGGKSRKMGYVNSENMSHGICNSCCEKELQKLEDETKSVVIDRVHLDKDGLVC